MTTKAKKPGAKAKRPAQPKACAVSRPTRTKAATAAADGPANSYLYSAAIGEEICRRLAEGESLKSICRSEGMPSLGTVLNWSLDGEHPFADRYARAKQIGYHIHAEEILEISDDSKGDFVVREGKDGEMVKVFDYEAVARARLRVETRKWILSKMLPKIYGDKVQSEISGGLTLEQLVLNSMKHEHAA